MRDRIRVIAAILIWRSFGAKLWVISALPSPGEGQGNVACTICSRALKSNHLRFWMSSPAR